MPIGVIAGFGSSANHRIRISALNDLVRIADGVRARGTGCCRCRIRSLCAGRIETCPEARFTIVAGIKNGRIRLDPLEQNSVLALDDLESADAAANVYADAFRNIRRLPSDSDLHRHVRRGDGEVDKPAHLLDLFLLYQLSGVEVFYFARDVACELRRSNRVMGPMPLWPSCMACQHSSVPDPTEQRSPIPVTTTLRDKSKSSRGLAFRLPFLQLCFRCKRQHL